MGEASSEQQAGFPQHRGGNDANQWKIKTEVGGKAFLKKKMSLSYVR